MLLVKRLLLEQPRVTFLNLKCRQIFYYAELGGDWDLDNDGLYGEFGQASAVGTTTGDFGVGGIELDYDLSVGRIPTYGSSNNPSLLADGIIKLDPILTKIINYQTVSASSIDWRFSALIATEGAESTFMARH